MTEGLDQVCSFSETAGEPLRLFSRYPVPFLNPSVGAAQKSNWVIALVDFLS